MIQTPFVGRAMSEPAGGIYNALPDLLAEFGQGTPGQGMDTNERDGKGEGRERERKGKGTGPISELLFSTFSPVRVGLLATVQLSKKPQGKFSAHLCICLCMLLCLFA